MKKNRNSKTSLIMTLLSSIFEIIGTCILLLVTTQLKISTIIFLGILLCIVSFTISIMIWSTNIFYIEDNIFHYKTGIFRKKENKIPLKNILGVDLEANLKERILGLKIIKIDRGATGNIDDIEITLKSEQAIKFRNELLEKNIETIENEENIIYFLDLKNLFLFASTRNRFLDLIIASIGLIGVIYQLNIKNYLTKTSSSIAILFIMIIFLIAVNIITVFINSKKYYGYKINQQDNLLQISSGFINKKVYSLDTEKVFAVKTTQNIIQKINNKVTISVSTFGYQDNQDEDAVVFPYIDKDKVEDIMITLFPKFVYKDELYNINKKYNITYKEYMFGYSKEVIYLSGGIFKKMTSTILIDSIEEVCSKQFYFQKKYNTYKLILGYKGKKIGDLSKMKGIDKPHLDNIIEMVLLNK